MAKNLPHCETGFGVYRSAQLTPHPFFLLLHLFSDHTLVVTNIYNDLVLSLHHKNKEE
jgi:hypothetical protein